MKFSTLCILAFSVAIAVPIAATAQVRATTVAASHIGFVPGSATDEVGSVRASGQALHSYLGQGLDSTASAFSYGDLATGKMGASASSNGYGRADGNVYLTERLSFYIPGATRTQMTLLTFSLGIDGSQGISFPNTLASLSFFQYGFQAGQDYDGRYYQAGYYSLNGTLTQAGFASTPSIGNWVNSNFLSSNGNGFGTLTLGVYGERPSVTLSSYLNTRSAWDAFADYSHTASLNLAVPIGVTWTSASGAFLSQVASAPEPSTWAMMIGGLGMVGGAMRRRKVVAKAAIV